MPSSIARRKVCQKAALLDRLRWLRLPNPSSPARLAAFPKVALCDDCLCAGFRMPACRDHPHARTAGVRKAPRHEIAGCGAPTVQRVLWGFGVGVSVGEVESMLAIGSL